MPTIEPVPPPMPAEKRFYGSSPESRKIGNVRDRRRHELGEDDVEHDQVEQRVQQRPHEPEGRVLVLDLQFLADQVAEQLAVLPDVLEPTKGTRTTGHMGPLGGRRRRDGAIESGHDEWWARADVERGRV